MKDLYSGWLMKLFEKWNVPTHKRSDYVSRLAICSFIFLYIPIILTQDLETGILKTILLVLFVILICLCSYSFYLANILWIVFLLFGAMDIVLGLAVDVGANWIFLVAGVVLLSIGIFLTPRQLRNAKKIKADTKAAKEYYERERTAALIKKVMNEPNPLLRPNVPDHPQSAAPQTPKENPGVKLLERDILYVLLLKAKGAQAVYMGTDGRMELFTRIELAEQAQRILLEKLCVETEIMTLQGPEAIRDFFRSCAHNAYQSLRLDNGSADSCELWLKDFFPYREPLLIDEKNRNLRHMLHRAKQYSWQLAKQPEPKATHCHGLTEMMLTMRLNGYRELGNTLVFALANPMPGDPFYVTSAAAKKVAQWLPGSGYEDTGIAHAPIYDGKLQLGFVNMLGEQGNISKGMVCVFTDLAQAKAGQAMFRSSNMDHCIVAITCEELLSQAVQCAGIVVDMQDLSYDIPKSEYGKLNEVRQLNAPVIVNLKRKPELKQAEMKGAWKQFDYQWPHRYGYDYMRKAAQWVIDNEIPPMTLVTAGIIGGPETEQIEKCRACGNRLDQCVANETGVLGVGGASENAGCLMKIYWYNQTNVLRIFTAGDIDESKINAFVEKLADAKF